MKKLDNKTVIILFVGSLLVIIALALIFKHQFKNENKIVNSTGRDLLAPELGMYTYDENSEAAATSPEFSGGKMTISADNSRIHYPEPSRGGQTAAEAEQRIIKTADIAIGVDGVEGKTYEIISIATGKGGFVQSSTLVEDEAGYKSGYVTVRVPSASFEDTIKTIKDLAVRVDRESITGRDVTEEYTDLEARLRSAKAQEEQYLEILGKAETVQDILAVQSYLQSVRYEIESLQGQIDSLGNQTEYSTISVSIVEEVRVQVPIEKFDLVRNIKLALKYVVILAQTLLTYIVWLIIVGGAIVMPLGLFVGGVIWVIRQIIARL